MRRQAEDHFTLMSAALAQWHDFDVLNKNLPAGLTLTDHTTEYSTLIVTGPKSRALFEALGAEADLSSGWLTHQTAKVAGVDCALNRVSFAGELGWEIHAANANIPALYEAVIGAGATPFGMYALNSMRIEKGYRAWKGDLSTDYTLLEGGMERFVKFDKPQDFPGKAALAALLAGVMEANDKLAKPLPIYAKRPQVVLVVGVNGSGKTTTIGKLASQFKAAGKSVVIAAGDTFRAAAVEQLQVWGDRAGVPVLTAPEGSDPASLAFDALTKAQEDGADLLMIDTAGRLQNRADLMEELAKIVRVIRKKDETAPHNTLLVLDATTGQNALSQVETFRRISDVSGLVMTKLDGTAKGGVLVALADKFGLPIHAIGVGEQIDDLAPFDPEDFAAALTGQERD